MIRGRQFIIGLNLRWNFGDSCYHNSGAEMNWSVFNTFTIHLHNRTACSGIIWIYVNVILWKPPLCKDTAAQIKIRFDAHDYCLDIGGYLVEIDTKEEEDWLLGAFAVYDQVGFDTKFPFLDSISSTYAGHWGYLSHKHTVWWEGGGSYPPSTSIDTLVTGMT